MGLAHIIDSDLSEDLADAVDDVLLYVGATSDNLSLTGISVTLPYNDLSLYYDLTEVLEKCNIDSYYIDWLIKFCDADTGRQSVDWGSWGENFWSEWGDYQESDVWGEWEDEGDDSSSFWGEWEDAEDSWLFDFLGEW